MKYWDMEDSRCHYCSWQFCRMNLSNGLNPNASTIAQNKYILTIYYKRQNIRMWWSVRATPITQMCIIWKCSYFIICKVCSLLMHTCGATQCTTGTHWWSVTTYTNILRKVLCCAIHVAWPSFSCSGTWCKLNPKSIWNSKGTIFVMFI